MDLISSNLYTTIGLFGVASYLICYTCLQLGLVSGQSYLYAAVVILSASSVLLSTLENFNLPTAVIQSSYILISLVGMIRLYYLNNHIRFSSEEKEFISLKFPNLSKNLARKLLNKGRWIDGKPDTVLATQGEDLKALAYISDGEAAIYLNGALLSYSGNDSFIGELTILDEAPATATVTISKPSRYFLIDKIEIKKLILRYPEIRLELTHSFAGEMKKKLINRNIDLIKLNEQRQED